MQHAAYDLPELLLQAKYFKQTRSGQTVAAYVLPGFDSRIRLGIEEKITPGSVKNGKLIPPAFESIKRRGGKRHTKIQLSIEGTQALHATLGAALAEADHRVGYIKRINTLTDVVYQLCTQEEKAHRAGPSGNDGSSGDSAPHP